MGVNTQKEIKQGNANELYSPLFFRLNEPGDKQAFETLISSGCAVSVHDEMEGQLRELIKSNNPSLKIKAEDYPALIREHLNGNSSAIWCMGLLLLE